MKRLQGRARLSRGLDLRSRCDDRMYWNVQEGPQLDELYLFRSEDGEVAYEIGEASWGVFGFSCLTHLAFI